MQKVIFQKSQKLLTETLPRKAAYSEHSMAIHSISMSGYITAVLAFVHAELRGQETSSFCDFWQVTFCDFTLLYSFLTQPNICFFQMCLVRNTIANLCPNMIHFDPLDFSECRSEEVISFLTLSVCKKSPHVINWESEGCYHYSSMFCWEPEGHYHCTQSIGIAPL